MLLSISFHYDFSPFLVVAFIAWFTPILLSLLKLKKVPTIIFEIIFGFIAGKFLFTDISAESTTLLNFFALFGFLFLMFLSGLEIDVEQILASLPRKKLSLSRFLKNPLLVGLSHFVFAILLSVFFTTLLAQLIDIPSIWYFSLIMVTTSVAIVMPVLKDRGEIGTRFGQMIIITAAVADVLSIILFTFTAFLIKNGFHYKLIFIVALFFLFLLFYKFIKHLKAIPFFFKLVYQLSQAASQIRVRGTILIIMIFVVISQYIGEEIVLLGAFLSGLVLSSILHRQRSLMLIKLDGMGYGFFIPFFFVMIGVNFDPSALSEFNQSLYGFIIALLITLFLIKIIPSLLWRRLFGIRKAMAGGFLISSRLSMIIAACAIGLELGVITPGINATIVIMAIITCFISPVLFNWISPFNITEGSKTIIIGGSSTAVLLARRLNVHGKKAILIEADEKRYQEIKSKGINIKFGDGLNPDFYKKIKLRANNYVVIETGNDDQNLRISKMLRNEFQHEKIISRINRFSNATLFKQLGVNTIDITQILATTIENLISRPTTYHALIESFENFNVEEITITNKNIDGLPIKDVSFHTDAIIILVKRNNSFFIPHGDSYLRTNDVLLVFGTPSAFEDTKQKINTA